jgi:hypothetical protein
MGLFLAGLGIALGGVQPAKDPFQEHHKLMMEAIKKRVITEVVWVDSRH